MKKLLVISALFTFIFVTLFGLNLGMQMDNEGKMSDCPFTMGQSSLCQMPASDHLSKWQQTFTTTLQLTYQLIFLSAIVFVFRFFIYQFTLAPPLTLAFYRYKISHPDLKSFNFLLKAFSKGIIQPKILLGY